MAPKKTNSGAKKTRAEGKVFAKIKGNATSFKKKEAKLGVKLQ